MDSSFKARYLYLQARLQTQCDWLVVSAVVGIMKPVINALLFRQTRNFFIISERMLKHVQIYMELSGHERRLLDWSEVID